MWTLNSTSSKAPMLLWVATTTVARPAANDSERSAGHGRAGWRRRTRAIPTAYRTVSATAAAVTTGAHCQVVNAEWTVGGVLDSATRWASPMARAYADGFRRDDPPVPGPQ